MKEWNSNKNYKYLIKLIFNRNLKMKYNNIMYFILLMFK